VRVMVEALRDLRSRPGRSVLTAISLFVAVISIVAIFTVGAIVRGVFIASAEQIDGRAITLQTRLSYGVLTPHRLGEVTGLLDRRIKATGGSYALMLDVSGAVADRGQAISLLAGDLRQVRRLPVLSGRWLAGDTRVYPGGVVVNQSARARYGGVGTVVAVDLGTAVRPYSENIVGVVADGRAEPRVYLSLASALARQPAFLSANDSPDLLVHYDEVAEGTMRAKVSQIAAEVGAGTGRVEIVRVDTVAGLLDNLRVTQEAFLGISAVTLVVAILGLLNIGLATVRERGRELTIRRAVGATRGRIFGLVLAGMVFVGIATALAAILLAYLAVAVVVPHLLDPASALDAPGFPWVAGVAGLVAALSASIAGGLAPALTAARVDIGDLLRE
jgi:FtsX-like permease family/MacB-like periplasmic core domain